MGNRTEKTGLIHHCTRQLLLEEGVDGLSMRKVAMLSGISLSNLQYYFKDRDELLGDFVARYFQACEDALLKSTPQENDTPSFEERLRHTLGTLLNPNLGKECVLFREIWALATKNQYIADTLDKYYTAYCERLVAMLSTFTAQPREVASLLLPYVEGYSITGRCLPIDKTQTIDMLVGLVLSRYAGDQG